MLIFQSQRGFSLIELTIVMAISVILLTIAYPVYTDHQVHVYRQRAQVALMHIAADLAQEDSSKASLPKETASLPYRFLVSQKPDAHFLIKAVPTGRQRSHDKLCGTLSLSDQNVRGSSGTGGVQKCW